MNKTLNIIVIAIICSFCISCKDNKKIKWDDKSKTSFTTLIKKIEVCPLQTKNVSKIGANPKLIFSDSCYYIIDKIGSNTVKKFDKKGDFITDIGEIGKQEGQYIDIKTVSIDANSKDVYINNGNNIITVYSKTGVFKKNIKIDFPVKDFITYEDKFLINIGYNNGFCNERLLETDKDFKLKRKYLPLKTRAINVKDNNNFTIYNNHVFIKEAFHHTIYTLEKDKIREYCSFCFKNFNIKKEYFTETDPLNAYNKLNNKGFALIYNYLKNTTVIEVKFYKNHLINRVFGIERNNKWNWINTIKETEVSTCAGIFQQITSDNKLLGIVFPSELLELYEKVPQLFKQKEMIKNLKEDDNPLIIITSLK